MTLFHCQQRGERTFGVATILLQLSVIQGNCQLGLRLTLQRTLQQGIAVFVTPLLISRAGGANVVKQWMGIGFGRPLQMTLCTGPASFGKVHLAMLDSQLHTATAVTTRPWVDHAA